MPQLNFPMTQSPRVTVVMGASPKSDRYAFRAMRMLLEKGFEAIPVNPAFPEVLGRACFKTLAEVPQPIDTVTMYLGSARSDPLVEEIIHARPRRIVFNPGAENDRLENAAREAGIEVVHGCTLVMLQTGAWQPD